MRVRAGAGRIARASRATAGLGAIAPTPAHAIPIAAPKKDVVSLGSDAPPKRRHGKKIDLDVKGADIHEVCRLLAEVSGTNIVVADGVTGTVTIKLKQVPWDEALEAILVAKGFTSERVGSILVIRVSSSK